MGENIREIFFIVGLIVLSVGIGLRFDYRIGLIVFGGVLLLVSVFGIRPAISHRQDGK
jgi:hypothetical protein